MQSRLRRMGIRPRSSKSSISPTVAAPVAAEVVIEIEASPINQYDLLLIAGGYGYRPQLPSIMAACAALLEPVIELGKHCQFERFGPIYLHDEPHTESRPPAELQGRPSGKIYHVVQPQGVEDP